MKWHPVAFTSRRLREEECNYHAAERETLAVIHALRTWRLYLFNHFEIVTDNQAVTFLCSKSKLSRREARWIDFLADFNFTFTHRPGKDNVADSLSRLPNSTLADISLTDQPEFEEEISRLYKKDRHFKSIISRLKTGSAGALKDRYVWDADRKQLYLVDEPNNRLCVPVGKLRLQLLHFYHDSASAGHPGRDRTFFRLARNFYWPGMRDLVEALC